MKEQRFNISLGGYTIQIEFLNCYIQEYCKDYITEQEADFTITITQEDINFEREKSAKEDLLAGISIRHFSDAYLETLAAYRKIAEKLLDHNILLFHGSVIAVDGVGYLFTAKSGTGKSTHTRFWRKYFGDRAVMVNDDKPLLSITDQGVIAWGTPWDGKHRISTNCSVPLKAICILERDEKNHIELAKKEQIYPMMLQQTYRSGNPVDMVKTLKLLDKLNDKVEVFTLGCNMNHDAAIVAYRGMSGKEN